MSKYLKVLSSYREIQLLGYTGALLHWDMETYMPPGASEERGELLELISKLQHRQRTAPEFRDAVLSLDPQKDAADSVAAAQINKLQHDMFKSLALSEDFVGALAKAQVSCQAKWVEAKKQKNFSLVAAELTDMVAKQRELADRLRVYEPLKAYYGDRPNYEILMDFFEPGFAAKEMRSLLTDLVAKTKVILPKVLDLMSRTVEAEPTLFAMSEAKQYELGKQVAQKMGLDFNRARLDKTNHPFCTNIYGDIRITTRYKENDFTDSLSSVIHEAGHGLYELYLPKHLKLTPCGEAASSGIHESQSRFYENFIGRSPAFARFLAPLTGVSAKDLANKLCRVGPSYIRVDADEITYNLHIALRFMLEEEMIQGKLAVVDLPERWNREFESMMGLKVADDAMGCMQDIHWYGGAFGYFPTYSLGNLLAAELFAQMKVAIPNWEQLVEKGDFAAIGEFQNKHVHSQAQLASSPETIQKAIGKPLGTQALIAHFNERYLM
jgi:carboxypeptidase Taq